MRLCVFAVLAIFPAITLAGTAEGRIMELFINTDNDVLTFKLEGDISETPRCNTDKQFAIDVSKPGGRAALEILLSARAQQFTLWVKGRNLCRAHWHSEDVHHLRLQ